MFEPDLVSAADAVKLIEAGRVLLLAGDEALLATLPAGKWIGGTSANFMAVKGGITEHDRIFVTDITEYAASVDLRSYSVEELRQIGEHYPGNGFTVLIVPGLSGIHAAFAGEVQNYDGVFNSPLVGWISGVDVNEIGKRAPKVFSGAGKVADNRAVAMHVTLPPSMAASVDIINLFTQGKGSTIEFTGDGFETGDNCLIDGRPARLSDHITTGRVDTKLPLVADYNGAMINVSIQSVDAAGGKVKFYAPVFKGIKYRFATPVSDYTGSFGTEVSGRSLGSVAFSCNCILNFLYAGLEGKRTGALTGPVTFGEIAYMLLNQTLVYLSVNKA